MAKASSALRKRLKQMGLPSPEKARRMLKEGEAHGRPLSKKFKGLLGLIASGKLPTRLADISRSRRRKLKAA